jgi:protein-S-isoprenylcysteine O-methyltransferase Ste14
LTSPEPGFVARLITLLLDHVAPACYYVFGMLASVMTLSQVLAGQGPAEGAEGLTYTWLLVQQSLTTCFVALIAVLFMIRRDRLGGRRGLLAALGTLVVHPHDGSARGQVREQLLPAAVALAGTNALYVFNLTPVTQFDPIVTIPSSILLGVGLLLSIVSLATLGRCFGVFPEVRGLVTRGPYAIIRHPLYLAEIIAGLGGLLPRMSPLMLLMFVVFVGLQYWRSTFEERVLEQAFPDYAAYRRTTWRIIPGVH